ncbi:hypothetical protein F5884DRAFT_751455 [Xylogone sp. PMI_703]|nr:hypothetical protein F5884DRAFT_751455 [Xylogone sp. PMI_703]
MFVSTAEVYSGDFTQSDICIESETAQDLKTISITRLLVFPLRYISNMEQHKSDRNDDHDDNREDSSPTLEKVKDTRIGSGSPVITLQDRNSTEDPASSRDDRDSHSSQKISSNREESTPEDTAEELSQFDWREFETRYTAALKEADDVENKLVEQFDNLGQAFSIWVQASSQYESDRALKRLKTRTRFVQLQEETLEQKKAHFNEVVHAFQKAMELLKRRVRDAVDLEPSGTTLRVSHSA